MKHSQKFTVTKFLHAANLIVLAAKRDKKALGAVGYAPKDLATLIAAKKRVDSEREEAWSESQRHLVDHLHKRQARDDAFELISHARALLNLALLNPSVRHTPEVQVIRSVALSGQLQRSHSSVRDVGTATLNSIRNPHIAPLLKQHGWSPQDSAHLVHALQEIADADDSVLDTKQLHADDAALLQSIEYVRTAAHVAFRGDTAKLAPYLMAKRKRKIARPAPATP